MLLVDAKVLEDVRRTNPQWAEWSVGQMREMRRKPPIEPWPRFGPADAQHIRAAVTTIVVPTDRVKT